jgi:hypothetical protein
MDMSAAEEQVLSLTPDRRRELCQRLARLVDRAEPLPEVAEFELIDDDDRRRLPDGAIDAYPLGQVQLGMLYHMISEEEEAKKRGAPAAYHNVATSHFRISAFSEIAFRKAVEMLANRHENFRTTHHLSGFSEPIAIVHRTCLLRLEVTDLRGIADEEKCELIADFERSQNTSIVNLQEASLIRFYIHVFTDHDIKLTIVEPHSISDGWSTHLTLAELISNYHDVLSGKSPAQRPLRLAYRQFIAAERVSVGSDAQRLFWQAFLAHATDTKLPSCHVADEQWGEHKSYRTLDKSLAHDILELARGRGLPVRTVLLAAHFKMLAVFSGSEDILTGVSFNGRLEKPEGTQVRGMFLNTLPMRVNMAGSTWADLLASVHATECMMLPFRRYPLGQILRVVGRRVQPSTMFSFHHFHSVRQIQERGIVDSMENVTDESRTSVPFETAFIRSAERRDIFTMIIDVDPAVFTAAVVESFASTYINALKQMTRNVLASHIGMSAN